MAKYVWTSELLEDHGCCEKDSSGGGGSTLDREGTGTAGGVGSTRRRGRSIVAIGVIDTLGLVERRSSSDEDNIGTLVERAVTTVVDELDGSIDVIGSTLEGGEIQRQAGLEGMGDLHGTRRGR